MGSNCSSFLLALLAAFIVLATAESPGATNGQNPITYPLGGNLNAGSPITITWTPTTSGTITLHILKGPPDNLSDLGPIAANIANSGSYSWSVPSTFEDSASMPAGNKYGIKIVDDLTGTFEYSPPFDMTVPAAAASRSTPTETASSVSTDATSSAAGPTGITTYSGPSQDDTTAADTTTSSASSASTSSIFGSSKATDLTNIPDLGLIFGAASAGVGGLIIIIVVAVVWARVRSDRKKANYYGKSFRDRRSAFDSETPTTRRHSRSSSSSSFGDRRASQLFNYPRLHRLLSSRTLTRGTSSRTVRRGLSHRGASNGRSSPPPPMPSLAAIQLRNPPPPLARGPLQVVNNGVPDSPPPPLTPLPVAVTRAPPEPLQFASFQPYKPRVYTPIRPGFEDVHL